MTIRQLQFEIDFQLFGPRIHRGQCARSKYDITRTVLEQILYCEPWSQAAELDLDQVSSLAQKYAMMIDFLINPLCFDCLS